MLRIRRESSRPDRAHQAETRWRELHRAGRLPRTRREDGAYVARLHDALEASDLSVASENVNVLHSQSPRLSDPRGYYGTRYELVGCFSSDSLELFRALRMTEADRLFDGLVELDRRCLVLRLDRAEVPGSHKALATIDNSDGDSLAAVTAIKKALNGLDSAAGGPSGEPSTTAGLSGTDRAELARHHPAGWRVAFQANVMEEDAWHTVASPHRGRGAEHGPCRPSR